MAWFANRIASTQAWAEIPLNLIADELEAHSIDVARMYAFLDTPFRDRTQKEAMKLELQGQREQSSIRLEKLVNLVPVSAFLHEKKARRDLYNDSYFENAELALSPADRNRLRAAYGVVAQDYVAALRSFALDLNRNRSLLEIRTLPRRLLGVLGPKKY